MIRALYVFYKDLSLHPSLRKMAQTHAFLPFFLWSEYLNQDVDDTPSLRYRMSLAKRFNDDVLPEGSALLMGDGEIEEIVNLCTLHHLTEVVMHRHFEPREKEFQTQLKAALEDSNLKLILLETYSGVPIQRTLKENGTPYVKFTPFYNHWLKQLSPLSANYPKMTWLEQPIAFNPPFDSCQCEITEDLKKLTNFLTKDIERYQNGRDFPYLEATSHASALINHGAINVHDLLSHLQQLPPTHSVEGFRRQLAWRDFYIMIADQFPDSMTANFSHRYHITWVNNAMDFQMWCAGQTGYPFVDAAMLKLFRTGRMHNRLRMVVASFLTKYLLIEWREGAEWFKEHLIDYDLASNIGGWQWAASTGADSVPYFRIFNPIRQSEKFDPYGLFIKSEVEMLEGVAHNRIHQPLKFGAPYIAPCVDGEFARKRALLAFKANVTKY